jgi:hypothetical protein
MPKLEVINSLNYKTFQNDSSTNDLRGYIDGRDFEKNPVGGFAQLFSLPMVPRSEWKERIEERERNKNGLYHIWKAKNVPILNQQRRPWCWCYGTIGGFMTVRARMNLNTIKFSAASTAAKIKNYRDVGGWAEEAIKGFAKYGCSSVDRWPEASNSRSHDTEEQRKFAMLHKLTKVEELPRQNIDAIVSSLFYNNPVTLGLMWWGHLVYALDVVLRNGEIMILIANSWGEGWGENGLGLLSLDRATAHEAFSLESATLATAA